MYKNFSFLLLILIIKKVNDIDICIYFDSYDSCPLLISIPCKKNKPYCQSINCAICNICDNGKYCSSCKPNYILNSNNKCVKKSTITNPSSEENKIKCHDNCFNCSSSSSNENGNMNCIVCKDNFYKMNGTNDCFDVSLLKDGFYLKNNIFYPCEDTCLTCSDGKNGASNNCLSCESENSGLYLVEDQKNCEYSNFTG